MITECTMFINYHDTVHIRFTFTSLLHQPLNIAHLSNMPNIHNQKLTRSFRWCLWRSSTFPGHSKVFPFARAWVTKFLVTGCNCTFIFSITLLLNNLKEILRDFGSEHNSVCKRKPQKWLTYISIKLSHAPKMNQKHCNLDFDLKLRCKLSY